MLPVYKQQKDWKDALVLDIARKWIIVTKRSISLNKRSKIIEGIWLKEMYTYYFHQKNRLKESQKQVHPCLAPITSERAGSTWTYKSHISSRKSNLVTYNCLSDGSLWWKITCKYNSLVNHPLNTLGNKEL